MRYDCALDRNTTLVYTDHTMKNITFSADEALIESARRRATAAGTTLNELFRAWLETLARQPAEAAEYDRLMSRLEHVRAGRRFSRDEMNERR
jgi:Arc/MetJ family transcription regulator